MEKKSLELTITIKADEATLREVQDRLAGAPPLRPALAELLSDWIKEWLIIGGVKGRFEVKLESDPLVALCIGAEGVDANQWREAKKFYRRPDCARFDYNFSVD